MCSQANVREESVLRLPVRALPSVIVDTEKVLREADGSVKLVVVRPRTDGKVFARGAPQKPDGDESVRSPKNTSVNLHFIINNGPGGQNSSRRQTIFFLPIDPRDKGHQDPATIDFNKPRLARYMHNAWNKHQDAVFSVDINLAIQKGLTFYQTRSNAIILQGTLPAYCIPKVVRLKTGEVQNEKSNMSPRPPPKISLRHDWARREVPLGSTVDQQQPEGEVARQPEGEVARQAKFFQPTQPILNPIRDGSGQPGITQDVTVVQDERKTSRSQEISVNSFNEELCSSDRSGKPDKDTVAVQDDPEEDQEAETLNINDETIRERMADMDFKIPGLPHSIVKHAQSTSIFDAEI